MTTLSVERVEDLRTQRCDDRRAAPVRRAATPTITLVIPTRNESRNLPWVLQRIPASVDELILVDGGSSDDTVAVARSIRPDVTVLGQNAPGKGAALATGLCAATSDIAVMMDADCSMDPTDIPSYVAALMAGADVVKGSRYLGPDAGSEDLTRVRSVGNKALALAANIMHGQSWSELCYGYAAMWTDILIPLGIAELASKAPNTGSPARGGKPRPHHYGHGFEIEALLFCRSAAAGLRVTEVASFERNRAHGESSLSTFRDGRRVINAVVRERALARAARRLVALPRLAPVA
jgi:glycosyltransferase involved in cell wall biosynthesis